MAATFAVLHNGQRHPVKLTPMQKLSQILDTVGKQLHQNLDPATCKLLFNKKQLDLSLPVRFANVPSGSTLELHSGVERKLGIQDAHPAVQQGSPTAPQEVSKASSIPVTEQTETSSFDPAPEQLENQKNSSAAPEQPGPSQNNTHGTTGSVQPSSTHHQSTARSLQHPADPPAEGVDPIGLGRPILLFRREVAAEQAGGTTGAAGSADSDESYYEFTPKDYQRVMAGQQAAKARAENGLRTEKLREQEMQRRAAALGPVPIHVHFQDGLVLQAKFQALEELSALKQLVQKCLVPSVGSWRLYTTPPKQVLKDYKTSFYKAGLVPAANVHFSMSSEESASGHGETCLREEVLAVEGPAPCDRGLSQRQQQQERASRPAQVQHTQSQQGEGSRSRQQDDRQDGSKTVPKWMKLGKK